MQIGENGFGVRIAHGRAEAERVAQVLDVA